MRGWLLWRRGSRTEADQSSTSTPPLTGFQGKTDELTDSAPCDALLGIAFELGSLEALLMGSERGERGGLEMTSGISNHSL